MRNELVYRAEAIDVHRACALDESMGYTQRQCAYRRDMGHVLGRRPGLCCGRRDGTRREKTSGHIWDPLVTQE